MKTFMLISSIFLVTACGRTNALVDTVAGVYPVAVGFNSICCGTPSEDFLRTFVKKFNDDNNVKLSADKIAGCGREGEYVIFFQSSKMKPPLQNKFIGALETLVARQNEANKKADTSSGGIELLRNVTATSYQHCRIKIQPWSY